MQEHIGDGGVDVLSNSEGHFINSTKSLCTSKLSLIHLRQITTCSTLEASVVSSQ